MIDTLIQYFQFSFVQYAFIVGVLISLCSSLLGVTLVLKRFSFIGDGFRIIIISFSYALSIRYGK